MEHSVCSVCWNHQVGKEKKKYKEKNKMKPLTIRQRKITKRKQEPDSVELVHHPTRICIHVTEKGNSYTRGGKGKGK